MNLPNALTVLRMALVPVFALLYAQGEHRWALVVYVAAALTDALDGYLARRLNQITDFGKLCDPMADKLMQLTMLACLAQTRHVSWWVLGFLLVKELYLVVGSVVLLKRKVVVYANRLGKAATVTCVAAILMLYPWHHQDWLSRAGNWLLYLSLALSLSSTISYTARAVRAASQLKA